MKRRVWQFILTNLLFLPFAFAQKPPKNMISKGRATNIAVKAAPGTAKSSEFEYEKEQWVYSFDILGKDKKIHEVLVNAQTGKIVESKIESTAQEAIEQKNDQKK